jgi:formate hydrogenlyase subunit 6
MKVCAMLSDVLRALLSRPATQRYPFRRRLPPPRLRGRLRWWRERCSGCGLCVMDCPAGALRLYTLDKATRRFVLRYHLERCTFCGQCVQSCNYDALELADDWELASSDRRSFTSFQGEQADVDRVLDQHAQADAPRPGRR